MSAPQHKSVSTNLRAFLDFAPLVLFFIAFKLYGLIEATFAIVVTTLISLAITYFIEKKIAVMPLVTAIIVTIFGALTIYLKDERFIKMKPTIVNLIFSSVLLIGYFFKKPLLKYVLSYALNLKERGWMLLSLRWGLFFIFLAALNEFIWRNFSTDFWVNFKVFGMLTCTVIFTILQMPLINRYIIEESKENDKDQYQP